MEVLRRALILVTAFLLPVVFGVGAYMLSAGSLATGQTLAQDSQEVIGRPRSVPASRGAAEAGAGDGRSRPTGDGERKGSGAAATSDEAGSGGEDPVSSATEGGSATDGIGPDDSDSKPAESDSGSGSDDSGSGSDNSGSDDSGSGSDDSGSDDSGSGSSGSDGGGDD